MLRLANHKYGLRTTYPTLQVELEDDELEEIVAGWGQAVPLGEEPKATGSKEAPKEKP
jgi:hypothetical protein